MKTSLKFIKYNNKIYKQKGTKNFILNFMCICFYFINNKSKNENINIKIVICVLFLRFINYCMLLFIIINFIYITGSNQKPTFLTKNP